ncbi:protein kinase domain-containing protein [Haliangium ochraceum]|uniref:non-specific serine/threonine protein kinase n=1 Tax=Haliangium ochraceum (strain DSM 14365 / JCM 11303 / SMP-2) TaxID=502025 RepID=D0LRM7_HALO1|nr:protein kinase [Haliangium ochraceum]ACY19019.1 serine/threonine protein kinase [Haliangium ochraceum DSM 14365]
MEPSQSTPGVEADRASEDPQVSAHDNLTLPTRHSQVTPLSTQRAGGTCSFELPEAGSFLGQYQIIRELGAGGMGAVLLARDTRLGRLVALKFFAAHSEVHKQRLLAEARATARCQHENIVIIYEVGEQERFPYLALEYLQGQTLRRFLRARTGPVPPFGPRSYAPLPPTQAVEIMVPVVRALAHAHSMQLVHRDLKPENVMITEAGAVKVLDFGLARSAAERAATDVRRAGENADRLSDDTAGTIPYMSPEQVQGLEVDHRCDIWACGVMLFELVTGRHPLAPANNHQILFALGSDERAMPSALEIMPGLGALAGIIERCLIKPREDRTASAEVLLGELEALLPERRGRVDASDNPFAGLASFQESGADRFFGRDREIAAAVTRLRSQPLVGVVGPSGAGKSSLVRAGLIPALKRAGEGWDALIVRPGRQPLTSLADALERASGAERSQRAELLREAPGQFGALLRTRVDKRRRRLLIFVDQFEELYTLGADADERAAFLDCLLAAADDASAPLRVVLSIRSDFVDRLGEHHAFVSALTSGLLFLPPIGREGLREALTRPVAAADHRFESPRLVERMLDELADAPGALPILQFTAAKLWELRDRGRRVLDEDSYDRLGGVAGALAVHADAVLASMSSGDQALARQALERLVTHEFTRAVVPMRELRAIARDPDAIERVAYHLAAARLLVVETFDEEDGATVELIHESLIHGWPTLRRWLDEHREDVEHLARLRAAAKAWRESGHADGNLWVGEAAREAQRWHARYRGELSPSEQRFLDASFALATREKRIKRAFVASVMVFLGALVVVGAVALVMVRRAERVATGQTRIVEEQLAELQSKEKLLRSRGQALQLALAEAEESRAQLAEALSKEQQAKEEAEQALEMARAAKDQASVAAILAERSALAERRAKQSLEKFVALGPQRVAGGMRFNYRPLGSVRRVYLAGSFNGWNPSDSYLMRDDDGDGVYSATVRLERGWHEYKFVVDGRWVRDPHAPRTAPDGFGDSNGMVLIE